jgi:hypothetical protein
MLGHDAFCPESGAPLSEERHYDESGRPLRAVVDDPSDGPGGPTNEGELTAGSRRSSTRALTRYFRRCHRRHCDPDPALYRVASAAIVRLKRTATGRGAWDVHVWYALYHHLDRRGFDVGWMAVHAGLRCPDCHGRLRFEDPGEVAAFCGTGCDGTDRDRLPEIRGIVARLATAALDADDPLDPDDVLRFDD